MNSKIIALGSNVQHNDANTTQTNCRVDRCEAIACIAHCCKGFHRTMHADILRRAKSASCLRSERIHNIFYRPQHYRRLLLPLSGAIRIRVHLLASLKSSLLRPMTNEEVTAPSAS